MSDGSTCGLLTPFSTFRGWSQTNVMLTIDMHMIYSLEACWNQFFFIYEYWDNPLIINWSNSVILTLQSWWYWLPAWDMLHCLWVRITRILLRYDHYFLKTLVSSRISSSYSFLCDSKFPNIHLLGSTDLIYGIKTKSWDLLIVNRNELKIGGLFL